jgi:ribosomal protein S18 acetylase RimI-like enzyme
MEPLRLGLPDAGELLTLQRAAYISEARAHCTFDLPPLLESLEQIQTSLLDPACLAWGYRDGSEVGRLVASVRIRIAGDVGEVGRLVVAPDLQGQGLGSRLLLAAEERLPRGVTSLHLFTGEHSAGPLRLYPRLGYRETHRSPEGHYELVHFEKARSRPVGPVR